MARERMRALCWAVAAAVLCAVSAAGAQTTSLGREGKVTPGREVRVGTYTSMRTDCTAGPLPAIRLSVAPEQVRRATLKATNVKQCLAAELPVLVAFYRSKAGRKQIQRFHVTISNGANEGQQRI
jgi:hypothetical protein